MSEKIILIGLTFVLAGIFLMVAGSIIGSFSGNQNKVNFAIGGFIGPFPFGFFSAKSMFWIWLGIMIIFLMLWVIFNIK